MVICHGETRMKKLIAFSIVIIFTLCVALQAQWAKVPPAKIPRTPDGKPNLSAPAPKLPDGKPDLSGIWEPLHVIERFRRKDFGQLEIQITIDDPKAYTKPWTVTEQFRLVPDGELMEDICNENNRDLEHLPGGSSK